MKRITDPDERIKMIERRRQNNNSFNKEYRKRFKKAIFDILGNKCVKCGFTDERALQIDHINGNGHQDRKEKGDYYGRILKELTTIPDKYQLLCSNCNWIKKFENDETPNSQKLLANRTKS